MRLFPAMRGATTWARSFLRPQLRHRHAQCWAQRHGNFSCALSNLHATFSTRLAAGRATWGWGSSSSGGRASLRCQRCIATAFRSEDVNAEVGLMVEGDPKLSDEELDCLSEALYHDARRVVQEVALYLLHSQGDEEREEPPGPMELSVVLCDDPHIQGLNLEWRGKDSPTDVLSFEMPPDEADEDGLELPVAVLGDVVVSLDTAARQAAERGYGLRDECRVLLVHGVLHLFGFDHELGEEEATEMAAAEAHVLAKLGWAGQGLIAAAGASGKESLHEAEVAGLEEEEEQEEEGKGGSSSSAGPQGRGGASMPASSTTRAQGTTFSPQGNRSYTTAAPAAPAQPQLPPSVPAAALRQQLPQPLQQQQRQQRVPRLPEVQLLCLDMDGTLLDSRSKVRPSSVAAIRAAIQKGVTVCLATGKARPAAIKAMEAVGLAGEGLVVSTKGPGVFLQGLAAYGKGGQLIAAGELPPTVVREAFAFAEQHGIPICGFLGEECITLELHPEIEELHHRYYEPLAKVVDSVEDVVTGAPMRKLLFMTEPHLVDSHLKPHWEAKLSGSGAQPMQAVPDMLEVVPVGWNKWVALERLLEHLQVETSAFMAIGDGSNDLDMVKNAGLGVAMGNAVPAVKEAATLVVSSNDNDGIAEAIERLIL